jgi:hypothetical protein
MDIWNRGDAAAEVSSRVPGGAEDEQATSQLPVHLVVPGTEPNMQSERLRVSGMQHSPDHKAGIAAAGDSAAAADGLAAGEAVAAAAAAADMFADVDDDMFSAAADGAGGGRKGPVVPAGLSDNYDDAEGYYNFQVRLGLGLRGGSLW